MDSQSEILTCKTDDMSKFCVYICSWQVRELASNDRDDSDGFGSADWWKAMQCVVGANVGVDESQKYKDLIFKIQ